VGGVTANPEVLVVGAGPVGLVLACELLQRGLPVRIIDAGRGLTAHSRANVVWPRNLELLGRIDVLGDLLAHGHRLAGTAFHSAGRQLGAVRLTRMPDAPHPFGIMISQNETERILRSRLAALSGQVEEGVRLVTLEAGDGTKRPRAVVKHPDGGHETIEPAWLVGADGAHSTVRDQLGVGFSGESVDVTFAIADAHMSTDLSDDLSHYLWSPRGAVAVGPMGGGVFRLAINVPPGSVPDGEPPWALFQHAVNERGAAGSLIHELLWSGTFRVRCRVARAFRAGRCFLAGDAAHVVSPAGGQGMNTGMQDAFNLAWKLAGVILGDFDEAILDTYNDERRRVSHQVAEATAWLTRIGVATTPGRVFARDATFRLAARGGRLQRRLAPQLSQTDITYGEPVRAGRPVPPGGRLPLLIAPTNEPAWFGPWPAVSRDRHTVLLHGGDWPAPDQAQLVRAGAVPFPLDRPVAGALARALGPAPSAVVVRPDGHLHARLVHADAGRVAAVVREARAGGPPGGPDPAARRRPALRPRRVAGPRGQR